MFHRSFALLLFKSPVVKITDFFFCPSIRTKVQKMKLRKLDEIYYHVIQKMSNNSRDCDVGRDTSWTIYVWMIMNYFRCRANKVMISHLVSSLALLYFFELRFACNLLHFIYFRLWNRSTLCQRVNVLIKHTQKEKR